LNTSNFPEQKKLTKEDVVIQLGDFGWVWYPDKINKEQEHWLDWLAEKSFCLAVVPGNHENYNIIMELPQEEKWGNPVWVLQRKGGKIYILQRGYVYNINNKTIFACGGAMSVDKEDRCIDIDWWPQEVLTYEEERRALDQLDLVDWEVDYVVSHTCPSRVLLDFFEVDTTGVYNGLVKYRDPVAKFFDFLDNRLYFKEWHFGHLHQDRRYIDNGGDIYQCHYNNSPYELKY
jgi:hypothetical protein